jgi:hypothetical protein
LCGWVRLGEKKMRKDKYGRIGIDIKIKELNCRTS